MQDDKVLKQCPEAESLLAKCFLMSRGFDKRISYEKKDNKEIINLRNRFCDVEIENIFSYESIMDMPLLGDVKYTEPQHIYFNERYKDKEIVSFGRIANEPLSLKKTYWHQEEYFDFRHIIKYKDKIVIITYQRPQHRSLYRSQPRLQLSYYEDNYYTKTFGSRSSILDNAFSESCSYYPWEKYIKRNYQISYCHYYDECGFSEIYREAENLLGVKLGYRIDLALKYLIDKRKNIKVIDDYYTHLQWMAKIERQNNYYRKKYR